jgi:glutathione S-transferase
MRARMALKIAGIKVEIREISLRNKPAHLLQVSPKGTVPVLVLQDGTVIEQSLAIMQWALQQNDPQGWLQANVEMTHALIAQNDSHFKQALDGYKYPERNLQKTQIEHRKNGEVFLQMLESKLLVSPFLLGQKPSLADVAIFPFVRQFAAVDNVWFLGVDSPPYPKLHDWLNGWVNSTLFKSVMTKNPTYVG